MLMLDTGSSDLLIATHNCRDQSGLSCTLPDVPTIGPSSNGISLKENAFKKLYSVGSASCLWASASMKLGEMIVKEQFFGAMYKQSFGHVLQRYSGILGLFPRQVSIDSQTLVATPALNLGINSFGIYLPQIGSKGELAINEVNSNRFEGDLVYEDCVYCKRPSSPKWSVAVKSVQIGNGTALKSYEQPMTALVMTCWAVTLLPRPIFEAIISILGVQLVRNKIIGFSCSKTHLLPPIKFKLESGNELVLERYYRVSRDDRGCHLLIMPSYEKASDGSLKLTFGELFHQRHYVDYDIQNSRVGFAKTRHHIPRPDDPACVIC